MNSLLIDTSQMYLQVEVWKQGVQLGETFLLTKNDVSEKLVPTISKTLSVVNLTVDDIEEIILVNGPGSFTGVRVGLTFAKMLATFGVKIKTVSSLMAMASNFLVDNSLVMPIIDARSKSVYTAVYKLENKKLIVEKEEGLYKLDEVLTFLEEAKQKIDLVTFDNDLLPNLNNENITLHTNPNEIKTSLLKVEKYLHEVDNHYLLEPTYLKNV